MALPPTTEHPASEAVPQPEPAPLPHAVLHADFWRSAGKAQLCRLGASVLVVFLIVVFYVSSYTIYGTKSFRPVKVYDSWAVFHYYLGAKYFPEVGYFSLYPCALDADAESEGRWVLINGARDMESYRLVYRENLPPCPRQNFTPQRWRAFTSDVEYFANHGGQPAVFAQVLSDKGFNPPPSWVALARPVTRLIPLSNIAIAAIAFNLDVPFVLAGILAIGYLYGGRAALLTATLGTLFFGNFGLIAGNYIQYLWFPFLTAAIMLWSFRRPFASGAMLGVAVGLQSFPIFFAIPIIFRGIFDFIFRRRSSEWRPHLRFSSSLAAILLASFLLGGTAGRGLDAWRQWQHKISVHRSYLRGEIFNIGLANLESALLAPNRVNVTYYEEDVEVTEQRLAALDHSPLLTAVVCILFLALWLPTVLSAPVDELPGSGLLLMYTLVSLSPFYYFVLTLVPVMYWKGQKPVRLYAIYGTALLFALHLVLFPHRHSISFAYSPHVISQCLIAAFCVGLAATALLAQRQSRQDGE